MTGYTQSITATPVEKDDAEPFIRSPEYTVTINNGKGTVTINYAKEREKQIYRALNKIVRGYKYHGNHS